MERRPGLDSVRGVACLSVLGVHALSASGGTDGGAYARVFEYLAASGVDLFFALSGFLITGILLDDLGTAGYFRRFYARRALRILPLYYFAVVVVLLLFRPVYGDQPAYADLVHRQWFYWLHLANYDRGDQSFGWLSHFWSLGIEEQFYLVWPAVVWLTRGRRALPAICLAMIVASPLLRAWLDPMGRVTFCRLDHLAWGAGLAWSVRNGVPIGRVLAVAAPLAIAALWSPIHHAWLTGVAFAGAIWWASEGYAWRATVPLRWVGRRSYGIYVYHFPIMLLVSRGYWTWGYHLGYLANHAAFLLATGALTCALAEVSWRFMEAPILALRDGGARHAFRHRAAAAGAASAVKLRTSRST